MPQADPGWERDGSKGFEGEGMQGKSLTRILDFIKIFKSRTDR